MVTEEVGKMIKSIDNLIIKNAEKMCNVEFMKEFSPMQGWILGFLYHNQNRDIFQKTLEEEFGIPKSTLAAMIKQLCDKGYVVRECAEHDTRFKKIYISQKGLNLQKKMLERFHMIEEYMYDDIPEEEMQAFIRTGKKIKHNLEKHLTERKGE